MLLFLPHRDKAEKKHKHSRRYVHILTVSVSPRRQHSGQTGGRVGGCSPDDGGRNLCTEEDAQVADGVGGKHPDDGEGNGEVFIQCARGI